MVTSQVLRGLLKKCVNALFLSLLLISVSTFSFGQASSGSIAGTVTDSSGSIVQDALITAVEAQSGTTYDARSASSGYYVMSTVRPGTYKLTATAPGFGTAVTSGVIVSIGTRAGQDIKLQVGANIQSVQVTANGPGLDTETSDVGTVISSAQVLDLPLAVGGAFRSLTTLSFLAPGAVGPGTNGGTFQTKIAGGQTLGSDYLIDGISTYRSENGSGNIDQTTPSVDAIEEFRIETSSLPADYGRTSGGIANFKTRSGTNEYHGHVYDFYKNKALDANNWFNNGYLSQIADTPANASVRAGLEPPLDTKNDYGVTLGGPVRIPFLYDGRNKTFFFFNFEQLRYQSGGSIQSTVPTVAQRSGDFSATLGSIATDSNGKQIINPCTGSPLQTGQLFDPSGAVQHLQGEDCRSATFSGNQIPVTRSAVAQKVLALIPLPTSGFKGTGTNNYTQGYTSLTTNTDYSLRLDQNLGTRNHFFAFGTARENSNNGAPNLPEPIDSNATVTDQFYKYARMGWDFTVTPRLVNQFSIGGNRVNSFNSSAASFKGIDYDKQLAIPNSSNANTTFPAFNLGESGVPGLGNSNNDDNVDNGVLANEGINWQRGPHSLRIGISYRWQQFSYNNNGTASGSFSFSRDQTAGTSGNGSGTNSITGNGIASFLLGAPEDISRTIQLHAPRWIQHYAAAYLQDDWKVRPNFTLNVGLRYSIDTPRYEATGASSNFDPRVTNSGAVGLNGALVFSGTGSGRNGIKRETWADVFYKNFEPRIGFSYSPGWYNGKVVLRGAYTIISGPLEYADYGQGLSAGFTQSHDHNSFSINPISSLDAGFPATDRYVVNTDPTQRNGAGIDYVKKTDGRPSTVQGWSLESQTQLAPDLIFTLGYIGQHSVRLHGYLYEPDDIPESALQRGNLLNQGIDSAAAVAAGIQVPFAGFQNLYGGDANGARVGQALRPFPQFNYMSNDNYLQNRGQATYNALEAKLERRFRNGLNLLASYTFSKTITDADSIQPYFATILGQGGTQNPYNLKGEKAVSNQDVPNNFVVSYLYELPVGHGKKFLAKMPRAVDAVVGGWRIGGVQRYLSGQPVSFFGLATGPSSGYSFTIRPNRVSGQSLLSSVAQSGKYNPFNTTQVYFNRAAFSDPNAGVVTNGDPYRFGNTPRVTSEFRSATYLNEDLSLNKAFPIHNSWAVDFRGELFNAFNRHVFNKPDTGLQDSNFGQIGSTLNGPRNVQFVLKVRY